MTATVVSESILLHRPIFLSWPSQNTDCSDSTHHWQNIVHVTGLGRNGLCKLDVCTMRVLAVAEKLLRPAVRVRITKLSQTPHGMISIRPDSCALPPPTLIPAGPNGRAPRRCPTSSIRFLFGQIPKT